MRVAIMQPYFLPYIGYFQLIKVVNVFVFYDDVNFIKRGWINRNRILINDKPYLFSIPLKKISQNKLINEIYLSFEKKQRIAFLNTVELAYRKAPFFSVVYPLVRSIVFDDSKGISNYAINSVIKISRYLNIDTRFEISSLCSPESIGMGKANRLIHIVKKFNASVYINAAGGQELYDKATFTNEKIDLYFLASNEIKYKQNTNVFHSYLSIIDVLMYNDKQHVQRLLNEYTLI